MSEGLKNITRNCKEATLLSLRKEEGRISVSGRVRLFIHLLSCDACKQFIKQSAIVNKAMSGFLRQVQERPPYQLSAESRQKIQDQLDRQL